MLTQVGFSLEYVAYMGLCNNFIFYNATLFQVGSINESNEDIGELESFVPNLSRRSTS